MAENAQFRAFRGGVSEKQRVLVPGRDQKPVWNRGEAPESTYQGPIRPKIQG